jgi:hypothetical protein
MLALLYVLREQGVTCVTSYQLLPCDESWGHTWMLGATDRWWLLERGILGEEGLSMTLN